MTFKKAVKIPSAGSSSFQLQNFCNVLKVHVVGGLVLKLLSDIYFNFTVIE